MIAILFAAALAFWPYIRAYIYTSSPVFPLYNEIFKSPFFDPINFIDLRWHHGASFSSYVGIFFESSKFLEATNNYVGGFQYFLLAPASIFLALFLKMRNLYVFVFFACCYLIPIFISLQYIRYFFAALPILSVLIGSFYLLLKDKKNYKKSLSLSIYIICLLNFIFFPGVSWMLGIPPLTFIKQSKIEKTINNIMPELILNRVIHEQHKDPTILFSFDRPYGATLAGNVIYNTWYSNRYSKEIESWKSIEDINKSIKDWKVDFVYLDQNHSYKADDTQRNLLQNYLLLFGIPFAQEGKILAFSISEKEQLFEHIHLTESFITLAKGPFSKNIKIDKKYSAIAYSVAIECNDKPAVIELNITWSKNNTLRKLIECRQQPLKFTGITFRPPESEYMDIKLSSPAQENINIIPISIMGR